MKKVFGGLLMLAIILFIVACSSSPKTAMDKYGKDLVKGDYAAFVDGMATKKPMTPESKEQLVAMLQDKGTTDHEKKGGLKEVKILREEIQPGDTTAIVYLQMVYGNGTTEDGDQDMILRDGKWKMKLDGK